MRSITLHIHQHEDINTPYDVHEPLPYPYHVDTDGNVLRRTDPLGGGLRLIGFQSRRDVQEVDCLTEVWMHSITDGEPADSVIGMFPVFLELNGGGMYNLTRPVDGVTVNG